MKKILVFVFCCLIGISVAYAQPRAIGARIGWGLEASYQHSSNNNFIEADLSFSSFRALGVSGTYNFMIAQPKWSEKGTWGFYAGPGLALSTTFPDVYFGIVGQIGLEYFFENTPIQLALDLRPTCGPAFANGSSVFIGGCYSAGLAIRYRF